MCRVQKAKKNYVFGFLKLLDNHLTADTSPENIVDSLVKTPPKYLTPKLTQFIVFEWKWNGYFSIRSNCRIFI